MSTLNEHTAQVAGASLGEYFKANAEIAIPDALRPTAVYAPGVGIPLQSQENYGAFLLSSVAEFFGYYSRYQSMGDLRKVTLWAFMTHIRDPKTRKPLVPMIPRIAFLGESGSGKTTDLSLLNLTCAMTDDIAAEPTEYAVRSMLGPEQLTVLLDEGDILFGAGKRKAAIRSMLNVSVYPNGHVDRIQGGQRVKDKVYGPAAIAALPTMEVATGSILETLLNRSHIIRKMAPKEGLPQILEEPEGQMLGLQAGELMAAWVNANLAQIVNMIPVVPMPPGVVHREAQKWRAMMAIAHVAGGLWPQYAWDACLGTKDVGSLHSFRAGLAGLSNG